MTKQQDKMKKVVLFLALILALIYCPVNAAKRMTSIEPVGEIPFTIGDDGRIYVTAFVNGSDSLNFLVDTGATTITLNTNSRKLKGLIHEKDTVDNMGTTGFNKVTASHDNSLTIGTIQYNKAECVNIPFSQDMWDGVLGLNGLSAFNIEINYDKHKIYCYPKDSALVLMSESYVVLPFAYKYDVPFIEIPIKLNESTYRLQLEVDTGSDRIIDLSTTFVNRNRLLGTKKPFAISRITSSDGGSGELKNVYFDEVRVGQYVLPKIPGAFSTLNSGMLNEKDVDGMIGNNFLKRFNMLIDFKSKKMYLQPNNLMYTPFYDFLVK